MKKFKDILSKELKKKEIKQREIADKLHLTQQTISLYCTGVSEPTLDTVISMAEFLNISTDELLTGERYENKSTRDNLGVNDATVNGLKNLCRVPLAPELLSDKKFAEIFSAIITSLSINFNSVKNVINPYGNSLTPEAFNDLILTQAVNTLDNYFREFFKEKIPFLQAQAHERAKSILSAVPEKVQT